ncbi:hypothetical protein GGS21DRAFT_510216 [Xylaria nigripes]|nr:hypothetical protein GGS21DRAFT_510216 [Xylaria nigripes]
MESQMDPLIARYVAGLRAIIAASPTYDPGTVILARQSLILVTTEDWPISSSADVNPGESRLLNELRAIAEGTVGYDENGAITAQKVLVVAEPERSSIYISDGGEEEMENGHVEEGQYPTAAAFAAELHDTLGRGAATSENGVRTYAWQGSVAVGEGEIQIYFTRNMGPASREDNSEAEVEEEESDDDEQEMTSDDGYDSDEPEVKKEESDDENNNILFINNAGGQDRNS